MRIFTPRPKDMTPVMDELRSRLRAVEGERDKERAAVADLDSRLAEAELERDRVAEVAENRRLVIETLTAERDKVLDDLATLRQRGVEEAAELRQTLEKDRQDFAARSRAHAEAQAAVAQREALLIGFCEEAQAAVKSMLVALGR